MTSLPHVRTIGGMNGGTGEGYRREGGVVIAAVVVPAVESKSRNR